MGRFKGWGGYALITGASSGIGWELAQVLARRGMDVVLMARSKDRLQELAGKIEKAHGVRAVSLPFDLSAPDPMASLEEALARLERPVDLLVNNAGFGVYGNFNSQGAEREAQMVRLNVMAPVLLTGLLLPGMKKRGRGWVVNVASTAAFQPVPHLGSYAATKAHLLSWTHSLDMELAGSGVRCSVLCPGSTVTNFHDVSGASERQARMMRSQTAADVAEECLAGLDRGKRVIVTGGLNRVLAGLSGFIPDGLAAQVSAQLMRPKSE